MVNYSVLAIAVDYCLEESSRQYEDEKIEDYVLRVMRHARTFWMDPELQLMAALAAAQSSASEAWRAEIKRSMELLAALSASIQGIPVDLDAAMAQAGDLDTLVPIMALWHKSETKRD